MNLLKAEFKEIDNKYHILPRLYKMFDKSLFLIGGQTIYYEIQESSYLFQINSHLNMGTCVQMWNVNPDQVLQIIVKVLKEWQTRKEVSPRNGLMLEN
jgi:hypothetical protein